MDETQALRTMAERLAAGFAGRHGVHAVDDAPPRLVLGALPDDWPATIPQPPGATVIGAICFGGAGDGAARVLHLLVDTPQPPPEVRAFYRGVLDQDGWTDTDQQRQRSGFVHRGQVAQFEADVEASEGGTHLAVDVRPARESGAHVQMTAFVWPPGTPGPRVRLGLDQPSPGPSTLPAIHLPLDAESMPGGSSGWTGGRVESAMVVHTGMNHTSLTAFIVDQLEQAGWARRDAGRDGALAWSTWAFTDREGAAYVGTLYVLHCPERPDQYRLSLVGELAGHQ